MNLVTSISPKHAIDGRQISAIDTWEGNIFSLNCRSEIDLLKKNYPKVEFIEVKRTARKLYGRDFVYISDILRFIQNMKQNACIINSDIDILDMNEFKRFYELTKTGTPYLHRCDYRTIDGEKTLYRLGIDALFVNHNIISEIPETLLALGCTHWDIYYPYIFKMHGMNLYSTSKCVIGHKIHQLQYDMQLIHKLGKHFSWLMGMGSTEFSVKFVYKFLEEHTEWL